MKVKVLNRGISIATKEEVIDFIVKSAKGRKSTSIFFANVHMLVETVYDSIFAEYVDSADLVLPDGMPIALSIKSLHKIDQKRISGMDMMHDVLESAEMNMLSIFFYGSTDEVLNAIIKKCAQKYPLLKIAGTYSPPFRELSKNEELDIITKITNTKPGIIFVSLGCPKQEIWISKMKGSLSSVMLGLGGAFPVFTDNQNRAPKWMQNNSLEWLFRLLQEPRRLWKRYLITNSFFIWLIIKEKIFGMILKKKKEKSG